MVKKGLGRGLGALIPGIGDDSAFSDIDEILNNTITIKKMENNNSIKTVRIMDIEPCKSQPRTNFDEESLKSLAESIKNFGIIQPIIVRPISNGTRYEIIAGERRWRAAQIAGLKEVPIVIRELDAENMMELALVENLQRVDLNPIDEALGYKTLQEKYNLNQEQIAERIGKNRSTIANSLRILNLPQEIKELIEIGDISFGHARALSSLSSEAKQKQVAEKIIRNDLSVRATEKLIKSMQKSGKKETNQSASEEMKIYLHGIEKKLEDKFGTKVKITTSKNKNKIEIEYYTNRDLGRILEVCDL